MDDDHGFTGVDGVIWQRTVRSCWASTASTRRRLLLAIFMGLSTTSCSARGWDWQLIRLDKLHSGKDFGRYRYGTVWYLMVCVRLYKLIPHGPSDLVSRFIDSRRLGINIEY